MLKEQVKETGLAISTKALLLDSYEPFEAIAFEWSNKANEIVVLDEYDTVGMETAKQALKFVSSKRIELESRRKELKAESLEYGRVVDTFAKTIAGMFAPIEDGLKHKAEFAKRAKEARQAETLQIRLDILAAIGYSAHIPSVELMDEDTWEMFLDGAKAQIKKRIAEEKKQAKEAAELEAKRLAEIEQERIAKQAEYDRINAENLRLQIEAVKQQQEAKKLLEQERQRAELEAAKQREAAAKAAEVLERQRAELEAANLKLQIEAVNLKAQQDKERLFYQESGAIEQKEALSLKNEYKSIVYILAKNSDNSKAQEIINRIRLDVKALIQML